MLDHIGIIYQCFNVFPHASYCVQVANIFVQGGRWVVCVTMISRHIIQFSLNCIRGVQVSHQQVFPNLGPPEQHRPWPPTPRIYWCNTWTEGELLADFYDMFQIIKLCFSIIIRNIFWGVGTVFKYIRPWFFKKFISLLIISSILAHACGLPAVGTRAVDCWQWRSGHYFHQSFLFFLVAWATLWIENSHTHSLFSLAPALLVTMAWWVVPLPETWDLTNF